MGRIRVALGAVREVVGLAGRQLKLGPCSSWSVASEWQGLGAKS